MYRVVKRGNDLSPGDTWLRFRRDGVAAFDPRLLMSFDWYFSLRAKLLAEDTIEINMVDKLS